MTASAPDRASAMDETLASAVECVLALGMSGAVDDVVPGLRRENVRAWWR